MNGRFSIAFIKWAVFVIMAVMLQPALMETNCQNIRRTDNWNEIFAQCGRADVIIANEQVNLDLSHQAEKDIVTFIEGKRHLGVGLILRSSKVRKLSFSNLATISFNFGNGKFEISDCPNLVAIDLSALTNLNTGIGGSFAITSNPNLNSLTINNLLSNGNSFITHCVVAGNRKLVQATSYNQSLTFCSAKPGSYVQNRPECRFTEAIPNAQLLNECPYVKGDLFFSKGAQGTAERTNIDTIDGCVYIQNTNLTSLNFLYKTTINCVTGSIIKNNPNLRDCEDLNNTPKLQELVSKKALVMEKNCDLFCRGRYEMLHSKRKCMYALENLLITNNRHAHGYRNLVRLKELKGRIQITKTNIINIDFLKSLEIIESDDKKAPPLEITNNTDLETLDLPNLKTIRSPSKIKVVIKGNGNYSVPEEFYERLVKIAGGKRWVNVDKAPSRNVTFEEEEKARVAKKKKEEQEEEEKKKAAELEAEEERIHTRNVIIGCSIGAVVFLILVVAVITATVVIVMKKKRKTKVHPMKETKKKNEGKNEDKCATQTSTVVDEIKESRTQEPKVTVLNMDEETGRSTRAVENNKT